MTAMSEGSDNGVPAGCGVGEVSEGEVGFGIHARMEETVLLSRLQEGTEVSESSEVSEGTASMPGWSEEEVKEVWKEVDEFVADPDFTGWDPEGRVAGKATPRVFTDEEVREIAKALDPAPHVCPNPDCVDGVIHVDTNQADGLAKAVDLVERHVMGVQLAARVANDGNDGDAVTQVLYDLIDYLNTLPQKVLIGVIMGLSDAGAGMFEEIARLEDEVGASRIRRGLEN